MKFASKARRVAYRVRDAMLWFLTVWILLVEVRHHRRRVGHPNFEGHSDLISLLAKRPKHSHVDTVAACVPMKEVAT